MQYPVQALLFLLPFAAFGLWRRVKPGSQPGTILLVLGVAGIVLGIAGGTWFGLSRSMERGTVYVPATLQGDRIAPGHAEPRR